MQHRSFVVAQLHLADDELALRHGDLVVVRSDGATELDWELMAHAVDRAPLDQGAHRLTMRTVEGEVFRGDAIVVRSVEGTHVFRGAGPIEGFDARRLG